jgi:hypothetical protein
MSEGTQVQVSIMDQFVGWARPEVFSQMGQHNLTQINTFNTNREGEVSPNMSMINYRYLKKYEPRV